MPPQGRIHGQRKVDVRGRYISGGRLRIGYIGEGKLMSPQREEKSAKEG